MLLFGKYRSRRSWNRKAVRKWSTAALVLALAGLIAWLGWLAGSSGLFSRSRKSASVAFTPVTNATPRLTPAPVVVAPVVTNLPPPVVHVAAPVITQAVAHVPPVSVPITNVVASSKSNAWLNAQIVMDRIGISSGSIDGKAGPQSHAAVRAFQVREGLPSSGELDDATQARLVTSKPVLTYRRIDEADITRLLPLATNWLGKAEQSRLDFETLLECLAEKYHANPNLIRKLNPAINWVTAQAGMIVIVPSVDREIPRTKATVIRIRLADRTLDAFDATNRLLAHFPCSIAKQMDKRPVGELHFTVIAENPNYTVDPDVFHDSPEVQEFGEKLILSPGPNNPVGTVWMGLDKPGYGIHGTPKPEDVGRTESHGCFRLANWNADYLVRLITVGSVGTVVRVEP